jgi:hypothetical protein
MARFDCARWRPVGNTNGYRISPNLGLVLHHAVANGSLFDQFNNPSSGVSANFWVSQSGLIEQYVDSEVQSWHGKSLNQRYCGVETEGCTQPPYADPMSDAMVSALGTLYSEGMARHNWPAQLANVDGQSGFGYHRMAVNTACPCDVRLNRRGDILNLAAGATPAPSHRKGRNMIASTSTGQGYWTVTSDGAISAFGDAQYKGGGFSPDVVTGEIIGIAGKSNDGYWLFASDGGILSFGSAQFYGRPDRA